MRKSRRSRVICGGIGDQIKLRQLHVLRYSDLPRAVPLVDHVARRVANCKRINLTLTEKKKYRLTSKNIDFDRLFKYMQFH